MTGRFLFVAIGGMHSSGLSAVQRTHGSCRVNSSSLTDAVIVRVPACEAWTSSHPYAVESTHPAAPRPSAELLRRPVGAPPRPDHHPSAQRERDCRSKQISRLGRTPASEVTMPAASYSGLSGLLRSAPNDCCPAHAVPILSGVLRPGGAPSPSRSRAIPPQPVAWRCHLPARPSADLSRRIVKAQPVA